MRDPLIDGRGVPFAVYPKHLPTLASDFPKMGVVHDLPAMKSYRWSHSHCQCCGRDLTRDGVKAELHHIIGGAGRSDEPCNLIMLCDGYHGCHGKVHGQLSAVLYAKWKTDRANTDWVRLAILYGKFLPIPKEGEL